MYNGILVIDKPIDFTSHDVVGKLRRILKMRQIGHAGTLDPLATGVLIILLGKATRVSDYAMAAQKEYVAEFQLGKTYDTQDITGTVLQEFTVDVNREQVKTAINSFKGGYDQLPPMYSAIQIDGKRLYDLARKGVEVERKSRWIDIDDIELLECKENNIYKIRVICSKGTYIRTICHDIGEKLGTGAAMTSLRRVRSGDFTLQTALTLEDIEQDIDKVSQALIPPQDVFENLDRVVVNDVGEVRAKNGAFIEMKHLEKGSIPQNQQLVCVFSNKGEFLQLGIGGELDKGGQCIFCKKSFI